MSRSIRPFASLLCQDLERVKWLANRPSAMSRRVACNHYVKLHLTSPLQRPPYLNANTLQVQSGTTVTVSGCLFSLVRTPRVGCFSGLRAHEPYRSKHNQTTKTGLESVLDLGPPRSLQCSVTCLPKNKTLTIVLVHDYHKQ